MRNKQEETQFLQYVLYVLRDSRSKKRAEARIQGLVNSRLEELGNCITYSEDMIKDYISQEKKEERTNPPNPLIESSPFPRMKEQTRNKRSLKFTSRT